MVELLRVAWRTVGANRGLRSAHGYHLLVTYQPDSCLWAFQGIEAGIFLVLAVALVAFASW